MPGVPDFYQGTEFWDLSLVDPDNRRPVDFDERASVLASVQTPDWDDARAKLARRPHQAGLDPASADTAHRTRRGLCRGRLSAAAGQRTAPRSCHCLCARHRGRDAAVIVVARSFAPMSEAGRVWPRGESYRLGAVDSRRLFAGRTGRSNSGSGQTAWRSPRCSRICRSRCSRAKCRRRPPRRGASAHRPANSVWSAADCRDS